jgi:hypothetical protein
MDSKERSSPRHWRTEDILGHLTHIDRYYLISEVYDGKFKYYRTPRVFAVEIRKYHHKNRLEKFYEIEQCKIAIN